MAVSLDLIFLRYSKIRQLKLFQNRCIIDFSGRCYRDNESRVLKGDSTCIDDGRCFLRSKKHMTIEMCKEFCYKNGWALAGVEWSQKCYCGNQPPTKIISDSFCNKRCSGNRQQICGGRWAINVLRLPGESI